MNRLIVVAAALAGRMRSGPPERGASLVEYALLVALVAVACIAAVTFFGGATGASLSQSDGSLFGS